MRIDIDEDLETSSSNIREAFLSASTILRYLVGNDDELDTMIMCNPANFWLVTRDQELYHALGSVQGYESLDSRKLVQLLEVVKVNPSKKGLLTPELVDKIRHDALRR